MSDQSGSNPSAADEGAPRRTRSTRWANGSSSGSASSSASQGNRRDSGSEHRRQDSEREGRRVGSGYESDRGQRKGQGRGSRRDERDRNERGSFARRDDRRDARPRREGGGGFSRRDDWSADGSGRDSSGRGSYRRNDGYRRSEREDSRGRQDARRGAGRGTGSMGDRGDSRGRPNDETAQRGPRSWDHKGDEAAKRRPEPELPETITGQELDRDVRQQLRTLSKENAEGVAKHLVAVAELLDDDPDAALAHAQHVVARAARVPAAREALGLVYYRMGEFAEALREFRTARRLSGSDHLLPYMVDCERGLGRYERALELANSPEARRLSENDNIELAIVVSGVRRDMGQARAAVVGLRIPALQRATTQPWAARLFYAYADALLDIDEVAEAREWFVKADQADNEGETDAADRIDEIDGFDMTDLAPDEEEFLDPRLAEIDLSKPFGAAAGPGMSYPDTGDVR